MYIELFARRCDPRVHPVASTAEHHVLLPPKVYNWVERRCSLRFGYRTAPAGRNWRRSDQPHCASSATCREPRLRAVLADRSGEARGQAERHMCELCIDGVALFARFSRARQENLGFCDYALDKQGQLTAYLRFVNYTITWVFY